MTLEELIAEGLSEDSEMTSSSNMDNTKCWDSLHHINLMAYLEEIFDVKFTLNEMVDMVSVADIRKTLEEKNVDIAGKLALA